MLKLITKSNWLVGGLIFFMPVLLITFLGSQMGYSQVKSKAEVYQNIPEITQLSELMTLPSGTVVMLRGQIAESSPRRTFDTVDPDLIIFQEQPAEGREIRSREEFGQVFSDFTISGDYISATIDYTGSPDGPYNFPWSGGTGTGEQIDLPGDRGLTVRYIIEVQIPAAESVQKEFTIEFFAHESLTEFSDVTITKRGSYYWGSANLLVGKDPSDAGQNTISVKKCDVEPQPPTTTTTTSTTVDAPVSAGASGNASPKRSTSCCP